MTCGPWIPSSHPSTWWPMRCKYHRNGIVEESPPPNPGNTITVDGLVVCRMRLRVASARRNGWSATRDSFANTCRPEREAAAKDVTVTMS